MYTEHAKLESNINKKCGVQTNAVEKKVLQMNKLFCPNCYAEFQNQPENCSCGYPFNGSDMDKYHFLSQRLKKSKLVKAGGDAADYARLILFVLGGAYLLISLFSIISKGSNPLYVVSLVYGVLLIGLGIVSFREPFLSLLSAFIILLLILIFSAFFDPPMLLRRLPVNLLFISGFVYGLIKVKKAQNVLKEEGNKDKTL